MARSVWIGFAKWASLLFVFLAACDGGTRGSGITGAGLSTVSGSIAATAGAAAQRIPGSRATAAIVVQVREFPDIEAVVDPITRTFALTGVPPGDVTIDFVSTSTASIVLRGLPEEVELRMVDVEFDGSVARPAGFAIRPRQGETAQILVSRRKGFVPLDVTFGLVGPSLAAPGQVTWSFGDGTRSGRANTSHRYTEPGHYLVEAVTRDGGVLRRAFTVVQAFAPSERLFQVTATAEPDRGLPPLNVLFTAHPEFNVGAVVYQWTFDDDTAPASGQTVRHTFTREGLYLVQVVARDAAGNLERDVVQVEVHAGTRPVPLQVTARADNPLGPAPHTVQFRGVITGAAPVAIEWDFDDGTAPSSDPSPTHTYTVPGTYFATVTVTEISTGRIARDQVVIRVL